MKRQMSISILLSILLIISVWFYIFVYNSTKPEEEEFSTELSQEKEEDSLAISGEYTSYVFYVKEEHGRMVVYSVKNQEIYMETGIETYTLPEEIKVRLNQGIFFETEDKLFDFLESYSS